MAIAMNVIPNIDFAHMMYGNKLIIFLLVRRRGMDLNIDEILTLIRQLGNTDVYALPFAFFF